MNALFPIIRRKRRPLLPVEPSPVAAVIESEPVEVVVPAESVAPVVTEPEPQTNHAKAPIKRNPR